MRPLRLKVQAFGPYAHEETLDFGVLKDCSFFLIHGPTGAGKTSILDAICFALYGETSGGERDVRHIRSDYASPGTSTEVTFDFSIGKDIYRVFRRPEQKRSKKRGEGVTKQVAKATLWKKSHTGGNEWDILASGWRGVGEKIERLLGFQSVQFRQVVVLPQGQFRRFLSASSSDRQQILQVLFQTGVYRRVEEALKEAFDEVKKEIEVLREKQKDLLNRFEVEGVAELKDKLEGIREEKKSKELVITDLRRKEESIRKELENAKEIMRRLKEYQKVQTVLFELRERKEEFREKEEKLSRAKKANSLEDVENEFCDRKKELCEAKEKLEKAEQAILDAQREKERADKEMEKELSRQEERDKVRKDIDRLELFRDEVDKLQNIQGRIEELERKVKELTSIYEEKKSHYNICEKKLKEVREKREEALTLVSKLDSQKANYQSISRIYERRKELEELSLDYEKAKKKFSEAKEKLSCVRKKRDDVLKELEILREKWRKSQAAILARELKEGFPCPVCGSTQHPSPAKEEGELPSESDIKRLQDQLDEIDRRIMELEEDVSSSRDRVIELETKIRGLELELGDQKEEDISNIQRRLEEVASFVEEVEKIKDSPAVLKEEIKRLEGEKKKIEEEIKLIEGKLQKATTDLEIAKNSLKELEDNIPERLRIKEELEKAIRECRSRYQSLEEAFKEAQQRQSSANEVVAKAKAIFESGKEAEAKARELFEKTKEKLLSRIQECGFKDFEDYRSFRLEKKVFEELDAEIEEFRLRLLDAEKRVQEAAKETEGLEKPNLEDIGKRYTEVKGKLESMLRISGEMEKHIEQLVSVVRDIENMDKNIEEKEAYYSTVGRLAEIASGRNDYNITFERFVLATFLDDVLASASMRLRMMSNGRFDLQRLEGVSDKRRTGGLELVVYDGYTGTVRPVSTLSGGEGFLASLSLALGLADVVQSYAGGIRLDTIFIDEGFGSLDPESLDLALRALTDLQKEGRLVGIISHVPELKERISVRLEVTSSKRGSKARFVF